MQNQTILADLLPHGAENGVSAKNLAARLGLKSTRGLRTIVEKARLNGELVLTDYRGNGYFLPSDDRAKAQQEIAAFYWPQRQHALAILRRLRAARLALNVEPGQISLDGEVNE